MSVSDLFATLNAALSTEVGKAAAKKVDEVVTYEFPDTKKTYVMDLTACKAFEGTHDDPACTFRMDESVFLQLAGGKADPMGLFMEGKIELDGDTDVAMKLQKVMNSLKGVKLPDGVKLPPGVKLPQ